jgi:hypothetical protein
MSEPIRPRCPRRWTLRMLLLGVLLVGTAVVGFAAGQSQVIVPTLIATSKAAATTNEGAGLPDFVSFIATVKPAVVLGASHPCGLTMRSRNDL